jgi:hypothetical protein
LESSAKLEPLAALFPPVLLPVLLPVLPPVLPPVFPPVLPVPLAVALPRKLEDTARAKSSCLAIMMSMSLKKTFVEMVKGYISMQQNSEVRESAINVETEYAKVKKMMKQKE